jgi:hypothetical protein
MFRILLSCPASQLITVEPRSSRTIVGWRTLRSFGVCGSSSLVDVRHEPLMSELTHFDLPSSLEPPETLLCIRSGTSISPDGSHISRDTRYMRHPANKSNCTERGKIKFFTPVRDRGLRRGEGRSMVALTACSPPQFHRYYLWGEKLNSNGRIMSLSSWSRIWQCSI